MNFLPERKYMSSNEGLRLLRNQSTDYQRYMLMKLQLAREYKLIVSGKLKELASFNYYIRKDELQLLKNKLKEQGLITK